MELVDLYDENRVPLGRTAERYGKKGPRESTGWWSTCAYSTTRGVC